MLTWLDQYTEALGQQVRACWAIDPRAQGTPVPSDYQLVRELVTDGAMRAFEAANRGVVEHFEDEFLGALAPFFLRHDELVTDPYACAIGRDLAQLFGDAIASPEVIRHADAFAKEKFITYIDVADRAFRFGQTHHLKAVVLLRVPRAGRYVGTRAADIYVPDETDRLRFFALVGPLGHLAQGRMAWHAGEKKFRCDDAHNVLFRELLDQSGKGIEDVARDIENLTWLTLAYAAVAEPRARQPLARAGDDLRDRIDRSARRQRRHFTLFQVERLRPPADNFGRRGGGAGTEGWQLERRIPVRGYFKMQPHGPNRTLRKLIFVDQHFRGPLDGPPLHKITTLDL